MIHEQETEVLVVGAGPVGMLTALLLAENNIAVRIIDKEPGPARHSYACGLHPASLQVLDRVGLLPAVLDRGRRLDQVALYEGAQRQAELRFSDLSSAHPYLVALPQNELEALLAEKLRATHRTRVEWDHRLSELAPEGDGDRDDIAAAIVCKLGETSAGYSVPVLERAVQKTLRIRAAAVVGADGHASCVRQELGLGWERVDIPEFVAVYDFETERPVADGVRIVFDQRAVSAMWPLPDNRCRWCLQVAPFELSRDWENKDREAFLLVAEALDVSHRQHVEEIIQRRAPWFESGVRELDWSAGARFE